MNEYLVFNNKAQAEQVRRKVEANFIRWRTGLPIGLTNKMVLVDSDRSRVDEKLMSDDSLVDGKYRMPGIRSGRINLEGYTSSWCGKLRARATDGKLVLKLPSDKSIREILLFGVSDRKSEPCDDMWFPDTPDEV